MLCAVAAVAAAPTNASSLNASTAAAPLPHGRRLDVIDWPWKKGKGLGGGWRRRGGLGGVSRAPLNITRDDPNERTCYMLGPNEPVKRSGQIGDGTAFGTALQAIAMKPDVRRVLEIGTWYGGGSTVNLGRGIRDSWRQTLANSLSVSQGADNCVEHAKADGVERCCHSLVMTLEVFEPAWEHARRYLRDLPVHCIRGSTVRADEMLQVKEIPQHERTEHFRLYYNRDAKLMRQMTPQLERLCARHQFELVLIDGNEYTGWAEFNHVRTECKPKYLALHDTQTLKTAKIEEYLASHDDEYAIFLKKGATGTMRPGCELVGCRPDREFVPNAAGFSIYKRVDALADSPPATAASAAVGGAPRLGKKGGVKAEVEGLKATVAALKAEVAALRQTGR